MNIYKYVGIEPMTRALLEELGAQSGPQLHELPVEEARVVFSRAEVAGAVTKLAADIEDRTIPGGPKGEVAIRIVRPKGNEEAPRHPEHSLAWQHPGHRAEGPGRGESASHESHACAVGDHSTHELLMAIAMLEALPRGRRYGKGRVAGVSLAIPMVAGPGAVSAVVQVESHPYLPQWELLDFCQQHGIVLLAFAALGHGMEPKLLDDPVITTIAQRVHKTPAQVLLAWAVQRGTALLTTSITPRRIQENFEVSTLPEDAMQEIRDGITTRVQFNIVVETGAPGFIPRGR